MDDDPKKQIKRKKLEEHRKWLEEMKAKQSKISAGCESQSLERKRRDVHIKANQGLQPQSESVFLTKKSREKRGGDDCEGDVIYFRKMQHQLFTKHFDLTKERPKTTLEIKLDKEMDEAVTKGDFREVERINRELYDIQFAQAVKEASTKASYEMDEIRNGNKEKTPLHWNFNRKERWERKGNN